MNKQTKNPCRSKKSSPPHHRFALAPLLFFEKDGKLYCSELVSQSDKLKNKLSPPLLRRRGPTKLVRWLMLLW